jgi:hypothetical protein
MKYSAVFIEMSENTIKQVLRKIARPFYRPVRRLLRFFAWVISATFGLLRTSPEKDRRLLVIYDFSSQPYSIGDMLHIQAASLVLKERHNVGMVDFAMVYNHQQPSSLDPAFAGINAQNIHYHLASLLPLVQVNPYLGSLFVFNSHERLQHFIADNADFYTIWPSAWRYAQRDYLNYTVFNDILYDYYQTHGSIPHLGCRQFLIDEAQAFYYRHVWPNIPVTVQTRNNPNFGTHRNIHMESWLEFFDHCNDRYPVKFVVVCSLSEVDDRLRQYQNVLIAKDFPTSIEQDLALIHEAAIHMGSSSGMATMAEFNEKPYLIVNTDMDPDRYRDTIREGSFLRFFFASSLQRFSVGQETAEILIKEFARMWETVDVDGWWTAEKKRHMEQKPLTWLR